MFTGYYRHQLDDKGRFRIPPRFRDMLGKDPVMVLSVEKFDTGRTETNDKGEEKKVLKRCIMLYTAEDFEKRVTKRFEDADILNTKIGEIKRVLFPMAQPVEEDTRNRVLMPHAFLGFCDLSKNLVSIGTMDHVEIWDEALYNKHLEDIDSDALLAAFSD